MPHLSPMNWIIAILVFWLFLLSISTSHWWAQPMSFPSSSKISKTKFLQQWMWSL